MIDDAATARRWNYGDPSVFLPEFGEPSPAWCRTSDALDLGAVLTAEDVVSLYRVDPIEVPQQPCGGHLERDVLSVILDRPSVWHTDRFQQLKASRLAS